jgi:hypothetical protein
MSINTKQGKISGDKVSTGSKCFFADWCVLMDGRLSQIKPLFSNGPVSPIEPFFHAKPLSPENLPCSV